MTWIVEEREGYTDRLIHADKFPTFEEAKKYWDQRRLMNNFAGVGGKWKHYFTYPQELKKVEFQ